MRSYWNSLKGLLTIILVLKTCFGISVKNGLTGANCGLPEFRGQTKGASDSQPLRGLALSTRFVCTCVCVVNSLGRTGGLCFCPHTSGGRELTLCAVLHFCRAQRRRVHSFSVFRWAGARVPWGGVSQSWAEGGGTCQLPGQVQWPQVSWHSRISVQASTGPSGHVDAALSTWGL